MWMGVVCKARVLEILGGWGGGVCGRDGDDGSFVGGGFWTGIVEAEGNVRSGRREREGR
jgi:hypothetical protein